MLCPEHHKAGIALLFGLGFDETWWPVPAPDPAEYGGSLVAAQLVRRDIKQEAVGRRVAGGRPMSIRQRHAARGRGAAVMLRRKPARNKSTACTTLY